MEKTFKQFMVSRFVWVLLLSVSLMVVTGCSSKNNDGKITSGYVLPEGVTLEGLTTIRTEGEGYFDIMAHPPGDTGKWLVCWGCSEPARCKRDVENCLGEEGYVFVDLGCGNECMPII